MGRRQPTDIVNVDFWADRIAALIKLAEHYGMTVEITGGELVVSRQVSDVFIARTEVQWREAPDGDEAQQQPETVHACPPDGSGLTPCCGRTPFELPRTDRISSEAPITCPGAVVSQPDKEA